MLKLEEEKLCPSETVVGVTLFFPKPQLTFIHSSEKKSLQCHTAVVIVGQITLSSL